MRATSNRSPMRKRMWSDWSRMMRWNWAVSAGSSWPAASSSVGDRPLHRRQGRPQLVADHGQELGAQPLLLLQGRQVLQSHHEGRQLAIFRVNRRGVQQDADAAPFGRPQHDLLVPHRLTGTERLGQGQLPQRYFPAVRAHAGHHAQEDPPPVGLPPAGCPRCAMSPG